jgi:hypothetical protein
MPLIITLIFSSRMVAILCLTQCPAMHYLNINHSIGFKAFYALIQKHTYLHWEFNFYHKVVYYL